MLARLFNLLTLFVLTACVQETVQQINEYNEAPLTINRVGVSDETINTATIRWSISKAALSQIEFGLEQNPNNLTILSVQRSSKDDYQVLTNLRPDTRYYYRVVFIDGDDIIKSDFKEFRTLASQITNSCILGKPILTITQKTFSGNPGDTFSYSATLKNPSVNCEPQVYTLSHRDLPQGTSSNLSSYTLSSGEQKIINASFTTLISALPAVYNFQLNIQFGAYSNHHDMMLNLFEDTTLPEEPAAPVLQSALYNNGNYDLIFSQPAGSLAPQGGYDTFINNSDQSDHGDYTGFTRSIPGLNNQVEQCFKIEARYIQLSPTQFPHSNTICVAAQEQNNNDTQAPSVPNNLALVNATSNSIQISWNASNDDVGVSSYVIEQNGSVIGETSSLNYTIGALAANTSYSFKVAAQDAAGNQSAFSSALQASTLESQGGSTGIKAFPTAEGFGKNALGGRGGQVIRVTNLNNSGPGSFRAAVEASGARTVIFDVGGRINLSDTIRVTNPYLTVAGQHSVGDGITLSMEGTPNKPVFQIQTHDVVVRYLTIRRSSARVSETNSDSLVITNAHNVIVDHCSISYASDENIAIYDYRKVGTSATHDITIQNTLIGTAYGGSADKGSLVGGAVNNLSFYNNFWASTENRNPQIANHQGEGMTAQSYFEIINNVFYDNKWSTIFTRNDSQAGLRHLNYINNFMKNPSSRGHSRRMLFVETDYPVSIYAKGNISPTRLTISSPVNWAEEWNITQATDDNGGVTPLGQSNSYPLANTDYQSYTPKSTPIVNDGVQLQDAANVFNSIKSHVGASLPTRDSFDAARISDFENNISTEGTVTGEFPIINNGSPRPDADGDGMPDACEIANGFNTGLNDAIADADGDGYTNLEECLNTMN